MEKVYLAMEEEGDAYTSIPQIKKEKKMLLKFSRKEARRPWSLWQHRPEHSEDGEGVQDVGGRNEPGLTYSISVLKWGFYIDKFIFFPRMLICSRPDWGCLQTGKRRQSLYFKTMHFLNKLH